MKRHPIFARLYDALVRPADRVLGPYRDEVVAPARGRVLEVGAGTGLNLGRYREAALVVAVEPEPAMARRAAERARRTAIRTLIVRAAAERLPFRDVVFDTVTSTLVQCSVEDPARAARETRRVLRSGGELRFFEHVRAEDPGLARWQDRLERPWGWVAGGCHPNRDVVGTLRRAGFAVRLRTVDVPGLPVAGPHVLGVAR